MMDALQSTRQLPHLSSSEFSACIAAFTDALAKSKYCSYNVYLLYGMGITGFYFSSDISRVSSF